MENHDNIQKKDFFCKKAVNDCFEAYPHSNKVLISFMFHKGYRTVTEFAEIVGIGRSRMSQIIHNHIPADRSLKIKIAKILNTDSRVIFPEKELEGVEE